MTYTATIRRNRTRESQTDSLADATVREWLRVDDGQDTTTIAALIPASLTEAESIAGTSLIPSSWRETIGPLSSLQSSYVVFDVFYAPSSIAAYYYRASDSARTAATITSYWDKTRARLTIQIDPIPAITENTDLEIEWSDSGPSNSNAVDIARMQLIALHYDNGETMIGSNPQAPYGVVSLLQKFARIY